MDGRSFAVSLVVDRMLKPSRLGEGVAGLYVPDFEDPSQMLAFAVALKFASSWCQDEGAGQDQIDKLESLKEIAAHAAERYLLATSSGEASLG